MQKYVLGIVIAIALLVVGAFFFFFAPMSAKAPRSQSASPVVIPLSETAPMTSTPAGSVTPAAFVTVSYKENGFSPATMTLKRGGAVRFVNASGRGMWVAADPHPVHTNYPEKSDTDCLGSSFDACKAIAPGGTWEFVFTETGTWSYHNHLQARDRGTIIVE